MRSRSKQREEAVHSLRLSFCTFVREPSAGYFFELKQRGPTNFAKHVRGTCFSLSACVGVFSLSLPKDSLRYDSEWRWPNSPPAIPPSFQPTSCAPRSTQATSPPKSLQSSDPASDLLGMNGLMSPPVRPGIRYGSKRIVEPYAGLQEQ